jgi:preprotein translocase subunit SecD
MRPIVQVDLSDGGRARFSDATEAAIGRKLAIVLDGRVVSAPVVQSRIPGGRIQITMGGSDLKEQEREAHDLVEVLRAGSMPPVVLIERRDVGPAR